MKKIALFFLGALALYLIFFKPAQALKEANMANVYEKASIVQTIEESQEILTELAKSITAEELYIIYTQSNELIDLVDVRSEEEYNKLHIERAMHVDTFRKGFNDRYPPIRVFFYSNNTDRSKEVANYYAEKGIKAYYVVGGLVAWQKVPGLSYLKSE